VKSKTYKEKLISLNEYINKQPKLFLILLGILLIIVVGIIDYLLGWEVSFVTGFLIPIALVAWFVGRNAGIVFAVFSVAVRLATMFLEKPHYSNYFIPFCNVTIRLSFFLIIAYLLSTLKTLLEREKTFARIDYLTGLANRRLFFEIAEGERQRTLRHKHSFTLVFMDIDFFKIINDRFGHHTGDMFLCAVAKEMKAHIRTIDTVARLGGDEFAILLPETDNKGARTIVRRINISLLDIMQKEGWPASFSFGVVTFLHAPASVTEMLKTVDELMYSAKHDANNKINYKVFSV